MLLSTTHAFLHNESVKTDSTINNSILESIRIHMRNVSEFFGSGGHPTDIHAATILVTTIVFSTLSKTDKDSISRTTSHLTTHRLTNNHDLQLGIFGNNNFKTLVDNIKLFLDELNNGNIKSNYVSNFQEPEIVARFSQLTNDLT